MTRNIIRNNVVVKTTGEPIMQAPANASPAVQAAMKAAIIQAGIYEENNTVTELSIPMRKQIAFGCNSYAGMIATRIQRLAANKFTLVGDHDAEEHFMQHGKYPDGSKKECRHEMLEIAHALNWCIAHAKDEIGMGAECTEEIVRPMIDEWLGGGRGNTKISEEQLAGYLALGYTEQEAKEMVRNAAAATRDYLAVKREHLGQVMTTQVARVLNQNEAAQPQKLGEWFQQAYNFAVSGGRVADAIIIKDEANQFGFTLTKAVVENSNAKRAEEIRNRIAAQQDERARRDAEALASFDPMAA